MPTQEEDEIKYLMPGSQAKPKYDWNEAIGGKGVEEMKEIAELIVLTIREFEDKQDEIRQRVAAITERFPLYPELK